MRGRGRLPTYSGRGLGAGLIADWLAEGKGNGMTHEELSRQRNVFIFGFLGSIGVGWVLVQGLGWLSPDSESVRTVAAFLALCVKAFFVFLTYHLSRFLGNSTVATVVYCVLAPFAVLYLVPFIGLLVQVGRARTKLKRVDRAAGA
jgi:hypothetical protein